MPDQTAINLELKAGVNRFLFQVREPGKNASLFARLLDPDRKLRYPEPSPPKR